MFANSKNDLNLSVLVSHQTSYLKCKLHRRKTYSQLSTLIIRARFAFQKDQIWLKSILSGLNLVALISN